MEWCVCVSVCVCVFQSIHPLLSIHNSFRIDGFINFKKSLGNYCTSFLEIYYNISVRLFNLKYHKDCIWMNMDFLGLKRRFYFPSIYVGI